MHAFSACLVVQSFLQEGRTKNGSKANSMIPAAFFKISRHRQNCKKSLSCYCCGTGCLINIILSAILRALRRLCVLTVADVCSMNVQRSHLQRTRTLTCTKDSNVVTCCAVNWDIYSMRAFAMVPSMQCWDLCCCRGSGTCMQLLGHWTHCNRAAQPLLTQISMLQRRIPACQWKQHTLKAPYLISSIR